MYNNPYNFYPYINQAGNFGAAANTLRGIARPSLLASVRNIKWGSILTNTQKTLNVINQAIPVYYQMKPIVNNIRSFGKIMSAFKEPDNTSKNVVNEVVEPKKENQNNLPTFFID